MNRCVIYVFIALLAIHLVLLGLWVVRDRLFGPPPAVEGTVKYIPV